MQSPGILPQDALASVPCLAGMDVELAPASIPKRRYPRIIASRIASNKRGDRPHFGELTKVSEQNLLSQPDMQILQGPAAQALLRTLQCVVATDDVPALACDDHVAHIGAIRRTTLGHGILARSLSHGNGRHLGLSEATACRNTQDYRQDKSLHSILPKINTATSTQPTLPQSGAWM